MRQSTATVFRFFEYLVLADHWGYRVMEFRNEDAAIAYVNALSRSHLYIQNWQTFRLQSPCVIPYDMVEAIAAWYTQNTL